MSKLIHGLLPAKDFLQRQLNLEEGRKALFIVEEDSASRLHYDFFLQKESDDRIFDVNLMGRRFEDGSLPMDAFPLPIVLHPYGMSDRIGSRAMLGFSVLEFGTVPVLRTTSRIIWILAADYFGRDSATYQEYRRRGILEEASTKKVEIVKRIETHLARGPFVAD